MASGKEIRTQIGSIKNTQKITSAMEMVAASKMRRAQDRMQISKPYAHKIRSVISHVANAHPEYQHPYLQEREIKRVGYIIVSSDRGLCGGLNINAFKKAAKSIKQWTDKDVEVDYCLIGNKAEAYFKRAKGDLLAHANHLGDAPTIDSLIGIVKVMLDAYDEGRLDGLYLVYNEFVNTMDQRPQIDQLLPVIHADDGSEKGYWDYLYEPDNAKILLTKLLTRYIESQVYQAVVENIACEQAARMVAMKSATDNAGEIINTLKIAYNKARQAAITREVCEIVAGADAVS